MKRCLRYGLRGCAGLLCLVLPYVVAAPAGSADDLGRLFTSQAERTRIDSLRMSSPVDATVSAGTGESSSAAGISPHSSMRLDGIVRRSNGSEELWLNGSRADTVGATDAQDRTRVKVPGTDRGVWMKPGQVFDTATGVVRESSQAGRAGR